MAAQDQDLADDIRNAVLKYLDDSDDDGESDEEQERKENDGMRNGSEEAVEASRLPVVLSQALPVSEFVPQVPISSATSFNAYESSAADISTMARSQYQPQAGSSFNTPLLHHSPMGTYSPVEPPQTLQPPESITIPHKLGGFSEMSPAQVSPPGEMPFLECMRNLLSSGGIPFDILLVADDGEVPAHNYFLSSRSAVFKSMLKGVPRPEPWDPLPAIPLRGVKIEVLRYLLEYMYTDTCKFSIETIDGTHIDVILQLYDIAKRYGMIGLRNYLYDDIISVLAESFPETVHRISQLKDFYSAAANNEGHQVGNLFGFQMNPLSQSSELSRNPYVPDQMASWVSLVGENVNLPFAGEDTSWPGVANGVLATADGIGSASSPGFIDMSGETLALHQQKHQAFSSHHWPAVQEPPNSTLIQDHPRKTTFAELIQRDNLGDHTGSALAHALGAVNGGTQQSQKTKAENPASASSSTSQPKDKEDVDAKKGSMKSVGATTMMVRNLPQTLKQRQFIEELNKSGFSGAYDFVYLPATFGTSAGKNGLQRNGYAFINFTDASLANKFVHAWNGSKYFSSNVMPGSKSNSSKIGEALSVAAAECQGLESNMRSWLQKGRRIRNPELRPYVKVDGRVLRTDSKTFIQELQMLMPQLYSKGDLNTNGDAEHNVFEVPEEEDTFQAPSG